MYPKALVNELPQFGSLTMNNKTYMKKLGRNPQNASSLKTTKIVLVILLGNIMFGFPVVVQFGIEPRDRTPEDLYFVTFYCVQLNAIANIVIYAIMYAIEKK